MAWSTAHSTWRGLGCIAWFLGSLRGTEQVRSSSTGSDEELAAVTPRAVTVLFAVLFAAPWPRESLGEVARPWAAWAPCRAAGSTVKAALLPVLSVVRPNVTGRAETASCGWRVDPLPSAQAVPASTASPRVESVASLAVLARRRTVAGSFAATASVSPVT